MFIIASKPGQLGNRLLVFASFIGSAMEHNFKVVNLSFDEYADYFQTTRNNLFCRYPTHGRSLFPVSRTARRCLYEAGYYLARVLARSGVRTRWLTSLTIDWEDVVNLSAPAFIEAYGGRRLVFVQGWQFRDLAATKKHAAAIREFFKPLDLYQANVTTIIEAARARGDLLVGVHIRHGDYQKFMDGRYFYELETYAAVMDKVAALFPKHRVAFLICSNAKMDEKTFAHFNYIPGTNHLIEDMYAFAQCDYLVGPPSTYTMWASFYGEVPLWMVKDVTKSPSLNDFVVYSAGGVL